MARPIKTGIDYFPLDVDYWTDTKVQFVSARFGVKGEGILIRLLCKIYRNGYYTAWNDDIALLFATKEIGGDCTVNLVNDVVYELVKRGFFDKSIFDRFMVLTSQAIQRRFLQAISERKEVEILQEYWLTTIPNSTSKITFLVSSRENGDNQGGNSENSGDNSQSKVKDSKAKETKGKKTKGKERGVNKFTPPTLDEVSTYCLERGNDVDPQKFLDYFDASDWVDSKGQRVRNWKQKVITWEGSRGGAAKKGKVEPYDDLFGRLKNEAE